MNPKHNKLVTTEPERAAACYYCLSIQNAKTLTKDIQLNIKYSGIFI